MGRLLGRIWVGFTTSLIAFIAFSSQIFVIWPWYGRVLSIDLLKLLLPFNVLVGLLYWNYYLTVLTDPGRVPKSWEPDVRSNDGYEVKRLTGNPRYCRMCSAYKPPRTHHCRQCKRCVLRMDHHCPWVNNCVGHYNYGHFIRFLFFVDVACLYHAVMITRRVMDAMNARYWEGPDTTEFIFIILNYVTCIPVLLGVGGFSIYHFYCLSINTTTIERWEKDKVAMLIKRGRIHEVKFPYNVGRKRNIEAVLGVNPLLWCCPSVPMGNGLRFPVVESDDGIPTGQWPPSDPNDIRPLDYDHEDDNVSVNLPDTPWTYENGSLNPSLVPSNAFRRRAAGSDKKKKGKGKSSRNCVPGPISSVPPYHPDFGTNVSHLNGDEYSSASSSEAESDDYDSDERYYRDNQTHTRLRRGSEGVEVAMSPADREDILRRYILTRGEEAGSYRKHVPEEVPAKSDPASENARQDKIKRN